MALFSSKRLTTCGGGVWTLDSTAVYFVQLRLGAEPGNSAIWRANPATGEAFAVTPQTDQGPITLFAFPGAPDEATLGAVVATVADLPAPFEPPAEPISWRLARVDLADGTASAEGAAVSETPSQAIWAPDGSGVATLLLPEVGDAGLFWLLADGGEPVLLLGATTDLYTYRWAAQ